ncbi:hypothetical protein AB0E69_11440 [Kribbella sp. NPDC026611]|uniref:hypothetical protein n=1 Tax=Kribbella sp. NPDC026611 TaxID=3154911 RepID=UPI0034060376
MSVVDSVFLAVPDTPSQVADWLVAAAGCEVVLAEPRTVRLRRRAETVPDWLGIVVQANGYVLPDPEPDEVQAMDGYPIEVQVRAGQPDEVLHREAGLLFSTLTESRPDAPMLLVHNLETLIAAHVPHVATHTFLPPVTPDIADIATWRPWVVTPH